MAVFLLQIDMFLKTTVAIIVATRYVFWSAGMPKMLVWPRLCPGTNWGAYSVSPDPLAAVCRYKHCWLMTGS